MTDAAIQGKLTEQLPEDGTAEELREEAIKYKEELAKKGILKNRKNKDIREITDAALKIVNNSITILNDPWLEDQKTGFSAKAVSPDSLSRDIRIIAQNH